MLLFIKSDIFFFIESYSEAGKKLKKAETNADINTDTKNILRLKVNTI